MGTYTSGGIVISNEVTFRSVSGEFAARVDEGLVEGVRELALMGEFYGRLFAPKRTGALAASVQGVALGTSALVTASAPHAPMQEFGAGAHLIPSLLRGGATILANPDGTFGPVLGPVEHPGNPATRFLTRSMQATGERAAEVLASVLP